MSNEIFNAMELDAIGEIMNISLGSSATAVSNLLDHRVDITTPRVSIVNAEDFTLGELNPAIGVEIRYVAGLDGSNIMLLKMHDVKIIVDILMGMETPEEEFELNDLTLSAVCEVMNQMMGASSTALSDFLGRVVNISTPVTFDGNNVDQMRKEHLPVENGPIVVVSFALSIEGSMTSEFMNVMSVELARELVSGFGLGENEDSSSVLEAEIPEEDAGNKTLSQAEIEAMFSGGGSESEPSGGGVLSQEEIERMMAGAAAPAPAPAPSSGGGVLSQEEIERMMAGAATPPPAPAPSSGGGTLSQEEIERLMAGAASAPQPQAAPPQPAAPQPQAMPQQPMYYMPPGWMEMQQQMQQQMQLQMQQMQQMMQMQPAQQKGPDSKVIQSKTPTMPTLSDGTALSEEQNQNLDLIMGVTMEIAVEIGRTRKRVQDILTLSKGSLVVLDKLAGDQVDVFVNGKCIAHGDVVVIDDNFGVRISEIVSKPGIGDLT